METYRHLKAAIMYWTRMDCNSDMADEIKQAIRKDQEVEHLFCKEFVRKQIEGKGVEGHVFIKPT